MLNKSIKLNKELEFSLVEENFKNPIDRELLIEVKAVSINPIDDKIKYDRISSTIGHDSNYEAI